MTWRTVNLPKKLKLGILWDDGLRTTSLLFTHQALPELLHRRRGAISSM